MCDKACKCQDDVQEKPIPRAFTVEYNSGYWDKHYGRPAKDEWSVTSHGVILPMGIMVTANGTDGKGMTVTLDQSVQKLNARYSGTGAYRLTWHN